MRPKEERAIYVLSILIGTVVLLPVVMSGGRAGSGLTIGFLLSLSGTLGLWVDVRRWPRRRLPRAVARSKTR